MPVEDDESAESGCEIALLLGRPRDGRILVRVDADGRPASLPTTTLPLGIDVSGRPTVEAVERLVGVPVVVLRIVIRVMDERRQPRQVVVELEPADVVPPPGHAWADAGRVREDVYPEGARDILSSWLDRRASGAFGTTDPPWIRPGWFARTSEWMLGRMAAAGHDPDGRPTTVYSSPLGIVLRAPSVAGACFLKCAAPHFAAEASITAALATHTPAWVPDVLAVDPDENWLLMRDLGRDVLGDGPVDAWVDGLVRFGEIQLAWVDRANQLIAAGAPHRGLERLMEAVPDMIDRNGLGARLAPDVRAAWDVALPRLVDACERLGDLGLPETVIHGDLHPWNIARTDRGLVVFDWSDGAIGHPFIDLPVFLTRTASLELRRQIRDAYLELWFAWLPAADLEATVDLAMVVGSLYQVATYLALLPALDPHDRVHFARIDERWVSRTLDALARGIDTAGVGQPAALD